MVGPLVVIADLLTVAPLGAGITGILHVALGAHHARVSLLHHADLTETPEIDHLQVGRAVFRENILCRVFLDGLDQGITHHTGFGAVGVVAVDTTHRVLGILGYFHDIGGTVPFARPCHP